MRNADIVTIVSAFQTEAGNLTLPVAVAWKRRLNMSKLMAAKQVIDEAMQDIALKYFDDEHSVPGEGDTRKVKPEYMPEYLKDRNGILMQETDVDIKTVSVEELGSIVITDAQMDTLAFMIKEGD